MEQIEGANLHVLDFDFDLTFMVFFVGADDHVYGRFGGRDSSDPDSRMSLAGLRYAMQAALKAHATRTTKREANATANKGANLDIRDFPTAESYRGCIHCHQAKEIMRAELKRTGQWNRERIWRYPLPDNLGFVLEVDRGDMIAQVQSDSPAAQTGLRRGDKIDRIGEFSVHSFGDAIHALDRAATEGTLAITWHRDGNPQAGEIELAAGWRRTDIRWRRSLSDFIPYLPLLGADLTEEEKQQLGLPAGGLAFRQRDPAPLRVIQAGIHPGDIILGVDGRELAMNVMEFRRYIPANYLAGDDVRFDVLTRDGQKKQVTFTLTK